MTCVFLLYSSRSGSTMLANQISQRMEDVLVFPELDVIGDLLLLGQRYVVKRTPEWLLEYLLMDPKIATLGLSDSQLKDVVYASMGRGLQRLFENLGKAYASHQGRPVPTHLLFQRGTLISSASAAMAALPSSKFIYLVRDPRASICSIRKISAGRFSDFDKSRMGRSDVVGLSKNWRKYARKVAAIGHSYPGAILSIKYESLCKDPVLSLQKISRFIGARMSEHKSGGLTISPGEREIHKNYKHEPSLSRIDQWKSELSLSEGCVIEYYLAPVLEEYGYDIWFRTHVSVFRQLLYVMAAQASYLAGMRFPLRHLIRRLSHNPGPTLAKVKSRFLMDP